MLHSMVCFSTLDPPDRCDIFCHHEPVHQIEDLRQRSKVLYLFCENVIQSDRFTSLQGVDADVELFKGERISLLSGLGALY